MPLPFTTAEFFDVFRRYNEAVWPAQWILIVLAVAGVTLAIRGTPHAGRVVSWILASFWLWMAIGYHLAFFWEINPAAVLFAALFLAQAALLAATGAGWIPLGFRPRANVAGYAGAVIIAYALVAYPLVGYALGHRYPASPTFGLPCPTTIFTFGLLLWAEPPVPRALLVVPALWAMIATVAALQLGVGEDLGLAAAAVLALSLLLRHRRPVRQASDSSYLKPSGARTAARVHHNHPNHTRRADTVAASTGMENENVLPLPGALSSQIRLRRGRGDRS
jgi:hypothetical protein